MRHDGIEVIEQGIDSLPNSEHGALSGRTKLPRQVIFSFLKLANILEQQLDDLWHKQCQ